MRTVRAVAAGTVLLALAGCGDKSVKVQVSPVLDALVKAGRLEFVQGTLFQLSDDSFNDLIATKRSIEQALIILGKYDQLDDADFSQIKDSDVKKLALQQKDILLKKYQNIDGQWQQRVEQLKTQSAESIKAKQQYLDKAKADYDHYTSLYATQQKNYDDAIKNKNEGIARLEIMNQQYTDAINKDIIEQSLPIRKYRHASLRYVSVRSKTTQCAPREKYGVTLQGHYLDKRCYYLIPVRKELAQLSSYQHGEKLLLSYKKLQNHIGSRYNPKEGTLYAAIVNAKHELNNAKIVAENKYGPYYKVERRFSIAKHAYDNASKRLERRTSEGEHQMFLIQHLHQLSRETDRALDHVLETSVKEQLKHVRKVDELDLGETIGVSPDMSHSVLVYEFKDGYRKESLVVPFNAAKLVKQEEPELDFGRNNSFPIAGHVDMDNHRLAHALINAY